MRTPSVLFVCLGNICRSPLAEAATRATASETGFAIRVDSAGTGDWHVGHPPDRRALAVAQQHGIDISHMRARQVGPADFREFDHIIAMDSENLASLRQIAPFDGRAHLSLLLDHVPGRAGESVADPYFGGAAGFAATWRDVTAGAQGVLHLLRAQT
ncbi:low molecular weight protein-tyrosine-phosphatase [Paracoccus sp. MBLB3053]|uniref:protein-tyrosine-phosphatase n=1 Tax=Paracoccus aurantius TaxID=3073814 RepID=A0ABU2HNB4_9RHOB|nr:low molecular weight protein-tyrosine-phosphatase [Paracoccus sp. MBLB3053]MDS9466522.1 low molecular weight protein-tyrosine-phosphatase [Paracoccus sp. MBLB3053]